MAKLGRNDLCHCGSGKKYKKCCLPMDEANNVIRLKADPTPSPPDLIENVLSWSSHPYSEIALLFASKTGDLSRK